MNRSRTLAVALLIAALSSGAAVAQNISLPPDGGNQRSTVSQSIGLVKVTIDYSSPDVHAPNGDDRRGKIWGQLVPYGLTNLGFGPCTECPWRAGANQNTTFTVSHDVSVEGQPLRAGTYGLHMIVNPDEWTLVLSKNATSWGSFTYDPAEDALRVKVKPKKNEYHEWLTWEFIDRQPAQATLALEWEDLAVPFTIKVDNITDLYIQQIANELRSSPGFNWQNWNAAAQYALQNKRYDEAAKWADSAVNARFIGQENFVTLSTLADAQSAKGMAADAVKTREKAFSHPTARPTDLHQYARQLLAQGKKEDAMRVWQLNAKRYPNTWPINVGLARGYSAMGNYKEALKYARLAAKEAPDELNRKALENAVKLLEQGRDMN